MLAGWLRSSEADEVPVKSGMMRDRRSETVSVQLPCTEVRGVRSFDATGKPVKTAARFARHMVRNVRLSGTDVILVSFRCVRD